MPDRTLSQLLSNDHAALTRSLERRSIAEAVLARLARRERRRWIVLGVAATAGAVVAGSQVIALAPGHLSDCGVTLPGIGLMTSALLIAATTAALGWSLGER